MNMNAVQRPAPFQLPAEVNDGFWEYQTADTQWQTYSKTISLLIDNQNRLESAKPTNERTYSPIYFQTNAGKRYYVKIDNHLQFDANTGNVTNVRRKLSKKVEKYEYVQCPICTFKLPSKTSIICEVCGHRMHNANNNNNDNRMNVEIHVPVHAQEQLQPQLPLQQRSSSANINGATNANANANAIASPSPTSALPTPIANEPVSVRCPLCQTANQLDFNFCVGCAFDLRDYKVVDQKKDPTKNQSSSQSPNNNFNIPMNGSNSGGNSVSPHASQALQASPQASQASHASPASNSSSAMNVSSASVESVPTFNVSPVSKVKPQSQSQSQPKHASPDVVVQPGTSSSVNVNGNGNANADANQALMVVDNVFNAFDTNPNPNPNGNANVNNNNNNNSNANGNNGNPFESNFFGGEEASNNSSNNIKQQAPEQSEDPFLVAFGLDTSKPRKAKEQLDSDSEGGEADVVDGGNEGGSALKFGDGWF